MMKRVALTGNDAAAEALKQVNPDVAAVFPITPQTELMHKFSQFVADGEVDTEVITVESEHSAMSACVGASAAGARTVSATSANGLALMWEIVYIAASCRLPIVMPVVNRALSGPINIHNDHSDTMGARDSGWVQIFSENAQEAYDNTVQAFRIAEHKDVLLPAMVTLDGFILSHTMETLDVFEDPKKVKDFVGEYEPDHYLLDSDNPFTLGPLDLQDYFFEHKRQQVEAMRNASKVLVDIGQEYGELSGRSYGILEEYKMDDAELVLVALGSTVGTIKCAVDALREKGRKVGCLKIRMFRPFPADEIIKALGGAKKIGIMDKSCSFGLEGGPVFNEIRSAAFNKLDVPFKSYIYGLGGRDITVQHIIDIYGDLESFSGEEDFVEFFGVRE